MQRGSWRGEPVWAWARRGGSVGGSQEGAERTTVQYWDIFLETEDHFVLAHTAVCQSRQDGMGRLHWTWMGGYSLRIGHSRIRVSQGLFCHVNRRRFR